MTIQPADVSTLIKVGFGALIAILVGLIPLIIEAFKQKNEHLRERLRLRQEKIIDPIISFLDEYLAVVSETYWSHLDKAETNINEKIVAFRNKEIMTEARVAALRNKELSQSFKQVTTKAYELRLHLEEHDLTKARDSMITASQLTANVLTHLFELDKIKKGARS